VGTGGRHHPPYATAFCASKLNLPHFRISDHEQGATTGLFTARVGGGSIAIW
jgi:hypothetical protein